VIYNTSNINGAGFLRVVQSCLPIVFSTAFHVHFWSSHYRCTANELNTATLAFNQALWFDLVFGSVKTVKVKLAVENYGW